MAHVCQPFVGGASVQAIECLGGTALNGGLLLSGLIKLKGVDKRTEKEQKGKEW